MDYAKTLSFKNNFNDVSSISMKNSLATNNNLFWTTRNKLLMKIPTEKQLITTKFSYILYTDGSLINIGTENCNI